MDVFHEGNCCGFNSISWGYKVVKSMWKMGLNCDYKSSCFEVVLYFTRGCEFLPETGVVLPEDIPSSRREVSFYQIFGEVFVSPFVSVIFCGLAIIKCAIHEPSFLQEDNARGCAAEEFLPSW